jgi:hypothetical protein
MYAFFFLDQLSSSNHDLPYRNISKEEHISECQGGLHLVNMPPAELLARL